MTPTLFLGSIPSGLVPASGNVKEALASTIKPRKVRVRVWVRIRVWDGVRVRVRVELG